MYKCLLSKAMLVKIQLEIYHNGHCMVKSKEKDHCILLVKLSLTLRLDGTCFSHIFMQNYPKISLPKCKIFFNPQTGKRLY